MFWRNIGVREMEIHEKLHKEIDLIQNCINRMANNSFMCKGWVISIVIAIFILLPENISRHTIYGVIILATLCFWCLDVYYLRLERLYRWKYEWVITNRLSNNTDYLYDLNPHNTQMWGNHTCDEICYFKLMLWNASITPIYGGIIGITAYMILFR